MIRALLTIDDVSSENTPAIVDYLCEKNITAIMFMVGQWAEKHPEELIYALKHGMIVGNHSYSHPHFSELGFDKCRNEIDKNEEVLDSFYAKAGVERRYRPFRFPYGDKGGENKELIQKYLSEKGFDKVNDTRISFPFWKEMGLDVMKRIYDTVPGNGAPLLKDGSNHILLLHAHDETEELVPGYYKTFIEELLKNGVDFTGPEFI